MGAGAGSNNGLFFGISHASMGVPALFRRQLLAAIPRLRRYVRSLVHDDSVADDLVQQTLERALTHWRQFDPRRDLVVWLLSIAHNAYMDVLRRESRFSVAESMRIQLAQDESSLGQGDAVDPGLRLDLQAALASLTPEMCEPLLLVCLEQLSYAEVAEVLCIPVGTVMSRVHRARVQLRIFLDGPGQSVAATAQTTLRRVV